MGVVIGRDEKVNFPHLYMKLAMDLEKHRNYPWGPMCGNRRGCAKCSYEDIIGAETLFPEKRILHSFMEIHIDVVVLLAIDFSRKDEKKDESKQEKACGPRSIVKEEELAASSNGNIDTDMKNFLEARTATERIEQFETVVTDRLGKMEAEVTQLKITLLVTELAGNNDQPSGPSKRKIDTVFEAKLLELGTRCKGGLPSHGKTWMLWNADVDRMYFPVWVNCNHWIDLCISFVTRNIQVFICGGRKRINEVEAFTHLIPWIVKAVQSLTVHKHLTITPYTVSYVPMNGLNRLNYHCGVYTITHIECHVLGLDISLVSDDNIWGAQIKNYEVDRPWILPTFSHGL
ncbi:hypothetical protein F2Q69_00022729 [Brassica cretica]|uniref:Ubiquitin-like protease family profile domain-containing protein n=1 Tax=Brassica cretica TaxID=69181 RepID=A0A8S9QDI7_BRACR|nr:hypothetical protein F2Q69_00022729 [Brassica cretica]